MTGFQYLTLGYALIWAALGVYFLLINRRIGRVQGELEELRRQIKTGGSGRG
jgi:CcmD family protein